jgi:RimJ/RimL family protein N-acetyltransferase
MTGRAPERVEGVNLALRLVRPDDAGYVHALRTDPALNAHLSAVDGTVADQRRWIEGYKAREAAGTEAYYVIERRDDGRRCGLVRLYRIEADRFTWGSWILDATKPPKAALESAVLSFGIGFEDLGRATALIDVRQQNARALAFYRRFGMTEVGADVSDVFFTYTRERFRSDRPGHLRALTETHTA